MRLAIFDFDGTLYKKETFSLLMSFLKEHDTFGTRYRRFFLSILAPYFGYKLRLYPERKMKLQLMQRYIRSFKGLREDEIIAYFDEIAREMKEDFNDEVTRKLHKHADNGLYTMIVSGAFTPLLHKISFDLPVDFIIGTDIPMKGGRLDVTSPIDHVQSERKTELIYKHVAKHKVDWDNSFAYGDSYADLPVLKIVGNPIAVCPDEKLEEIAKNKNWTILN